MRNKIRYRYRRLRRSVGLSFRCNIASPYCAGLDVRHFMMSEALRLPTEVLDSKLDLCMSALVEARRLTDVRVYGPILTHVLGRAGELVEDIDEILRGVDEAAHREAFAKASAFRRELRRLTDLAARGRQAVRKP